MADSVKLPGMGEVSKKEAYVLGGILVVVMGVAYYRHSKNKAAAVSSTGSAAIDPATGQIAGSPEDQAALAAQAGTYSYTGYGSGSGSGSVNTQGGGPATPASGFVSNAQWAQAAEDYLVNTVYQGDSSHAASVAAAIGKYLTGQPLSSDMLAIVEQSIAFQGLPPVAGTDGFPPSFHTLTGVSGNPPSGGGTVPAKHVPDGYYRDGTTGAIYKVVNNQMYHMTAGTWSKMNPKPAVTEVGPGWAARVGIPYAGEL
jgi:hypothetical protein